MIERWVGEFFLSKSDIYLLPNSSSQMSIIAESITESAERSGRIGEAEMK
jgi:hypothetical protein